MAIKSFIFGGNAEAKTPAELERRRAMIEQLSPNFGSADSVGEGVGHALTGLAMGIQMRRANKAESAGRASGAKVYNDIMTRAFPSSKPSTIGDKPKGETPTNDIAPKPTSKQKIQAALEKQKEPERVEVASLGPNDTGSKPTGKGLAALDRGGRLNYSKEWQALEPDDEMTHIVAGAGQEMGEDINVTSGHRPLDYNRKIGSSDGSKHITREAMDISMAGMDDKRRQELVQHLTQRGANRFITYDNLPDTLHVDIGKRDGEFEPRFMHNKSAKYLSSAPQWYQDIAERDGVLLPSGASTPIPAPSPNVASNGGNLGDPNGTISPAQTPQQAIAQNFDNPAPSQQSPFAQTAQSFTPDPREREILARTLQAEAGGEGLQGMLDVGSTIRNRVESGKYGAGIEDVIMKDGQFSAWNGVTGYNGGRGGLDMANMQPSKDAYAAADAILSGKTEDATGGATHYYNNSQVNPKWGAAAGGEWEQRGAHIFGNADGVNVPAYSGPVNSSQQLPNGAQTPQDIAQMAYTQMPNQVDNLQNVDPRKMLENGPVQVASLGDVDPSLLYESMPNQAPQPAQRQLTPEMEAMRRAQQEQSSPQLAPQAQPQAPQPMQQPTQQQAPQPMQQQAQNNQIGVRELIEASQNPWLTDGQRGTIQMLLEREMQNADPLRKLEIEKARQELQTGAPDYESPADRLAREKFEFEKNQRDLATSSKEYEYYKAEMERLGRPALGPLEYRQAVKRSGAASTNVTVNGNNSSKFTEESDKLAAGRLNEIVQSGSAAPEMMGQMRQLADMSRIIGTGKSAEFMVAVGPYAEALGVNIDGLDAAQSFRAITSRLAPQMRPVGSGSSSDKDVEMFLQSLPVLGNTPEGNRLIAGTFEAVLGNRIKAAEIASLAYRAPADGGITWQEAEKRIRELPNPYDEFLKSGATNGTTLEGMNQEGFTTLKNKYGLE